VAVVRQAEWAPPATAEAAPCRLCGAPAAVRYANVRDWFFGTPGAFTYSACTGPRCGALQIEPLPDPVRLRAAYAGYHGDGPARRAGLDRALAAAWRRGFRPRAERGPMARFRKRYGLIPPGARDVLDVGCGAGEALAVLAAMGVERPVGVEPDPAARAAAARAGRDVLAGEGDALPVDDGAMDAVRMHHVIEHVRHPGAVLEEAVRVLRPGGALVLVTPNVASAAHARWGMHWRGLEAPRHLHLFSGAALKRLLAAAGFAAARVETSALSGAWIERASRAAASAHTEARAGWWGDPDPLREGGASRWAGDDLVVVATRP
jgi:SAM-dependent methyltransferase